MLPNIDGCPNPPPCCCPNAGALVWPKRFVPVLAAELVLLAPKEKELALLVLEDPNSPPPPAPPPPPPAALEAGALAGGFVCPKPELAPKVDCPKVNPLAEPADAVGCPKPPEVLCPNTGFPKPEVVEAAPKVEVPNTGAEEVVVVVVAVGATVATVAG